MRWIAFIGAILTCAMFASAGSADPAGPAVSRTAAEWYAMGGVAMHGLALCSVLALGLVLERLFALRRAVTLPRDLAKQVDIAIAGGNPNELKSIAEEGASSLARVVWLMLQPNSSYDRVEARGALEVHLLQRNLPLLASVGNLATMIGLFGTVMGMIDAFDVIAISGSSDASLVAGGIFRALVTTAGGLAVGISALGAHALLLRRSEEFAAALEERSVALFSTIHPRSGPGEVSELHEVRSIVL